MRNHLRIFTAILLTAAGAATEAPAQGTDRLVFVQGRETGSGITRRRGDECFVVAPDHVVRGDTTGNAAFRHAPDTVWIVASGNRRIPTTWERSLVQDLAILRVSRKSPYAATLCALWPRVRTNADLQRSLDRDEPYPKGELVGRGPGGVEVRRRVNVRYRGEAQFTVVVEGNDEPIKLGMSGSLVTVNGIPYGMLLGRVGKDTSHAVIQSLDAVEDIIHRYFVDNVPPSRGMIMTSLAIPGRGQALTRRRSLGALWLGTTVVTSALAVWYPRTVTRVEIVPDEFGVPRSYPYQDREYPYKGYALPVWLLSGAASVWEAGRYVRVQYEHDTSGSAAQRRTSLRMNAYPASVEGEPAIVLGVGLSF